MAEYRLLADTMWVGEGKDLRRASRGEVVEVEDERRAKVLLDSGVLVKKGDETDEQKKEFEGDDSKAEKERADREAIAKLDEQVEKMSGEKSNTTKKTDSAQAQPQPAGAPKVAQK